tara:strand:+ start:10280 stop:11458 length:1179 start_codon:yes stop_codon:yes gene_type:complete
MLEQAIVDAQALREAALKNAEQALIEKYAPQIKEAVETLLETDEVVEARKVKFEGQIYNVLEEADENGKVMIQQEGEKAHLVSESELEEVLQEEVIQEEESPAMEASPSAAVEAPFAGSPVVDPNQNVEMTMDVEEPVYEFDLNFLKSEDDAEEAQDEDKSGPSDILDDILGDDKESALNESDEASDDLVNEILELMNEMNEEEEEVIEEELVVDTSAQKTGTFETNEATLQYEMELEKARQESDEMKEEMEDMKKENEKLQETIKKFTHKNKQYKDAVEKLSNKLNETLLSNAKLLYSNKTLGDASLNERQKNKIVEAIAKARTPEEAKNLCETLNATVNSGSDSKAPRTLSESVQRKSNLSGILPRRNKQVNESVEHTFAEQMKKLAGIK